MKEYTVGEIYMKHDFIYQGVTWKKLGWFYNTLHIKEYLGFQDKDKDKLIHLVKCAPKLGGNYQIEMAKYFNEATIIERVEMVELTV